MPPAMPPARRGADSRGGLPPARRGPEDSFSGMPPARRGGPPARRGPEDSFDRMPPVRRGPDADDRMLTTIDQIPPADATTVDQIPPLGRADAGDRLPPARRSTPNRVTPARKPATRRAAEDVQPPARRGAEDSFSGMPPARGGSPTNGGRAARRRAEESLSRMVPLGGDDRSRQADPALSKIRVVPALPSMDDVFDRLPRAPKHSRAEDYDSVVRQRSGPEDSYDQMPAVERPVRSSGGRRRA